MPRIYGADGLTAIAPAPVVAMRESVSLLTRQVEDLGWSTIGADPTSRLDYSYDTRVRIIERARSMARQNPLAKTAINLLQHYVLGQGVSVKATNRSLVARIVDEFMNDTRNKSVITSHQAQKEFLAGLFEDGDYFLVLFPDVVSGTLQIGWLDAALVEDAIADPGNAKITKWYKARKPNTLYNFMTGTYEVGVGQEFVFYRHWQNDDPVPAGMEGRLQPGLVYQVSVDKRGKFGRSQLANAMDWLKAHREFMEDRATINRAAAAVAWKKKRAGGASDVNAEAAKIGTSLTNRADRFDTNPPRASGSTIIENAGSTLEWVDTNTGGQAADFDERKLRMMAGAGMGGIPNHYFGDVADANLATATAMELPMLKMYEDYQQVVRTTLDDLIDFALAVAHEAGRIGERDDSDKYADRVTTPQGVMTAPEQQTAPEAGNRPVATPGRAAATVIKTVVTREAGLVLPYQPAPQGLRLVPRPDDMPLDDQQQALTASDPVSWYVDIDFPPIVQKQIDLWMNAVKILFDMLPPENIESRKFATEQALVGLGVDSIPETIARLFPPDMVAVQIPAAPPPPPQFGQQPPQLAEGAVSLAEVRRRRLYDVASGVISAVGS